MAPHFTSGSTGFGWVTLNGVTHSEDIIIHTDGSISKRKQKLSKKFKPMFNHTPLSLDELSLLSDEKPEIIYIATGQSGALPLTDDAKQYLEHFTVRVDTTPEIISELLTETGRYLAIIHVTC